MSENRQEIEQLRTLLDEWRTGRGGRVSKMAALAPQMLPLMAELLIEIAETYKSRTA
jgi:hypothetical protein